MAFKKALIERALGAEMHHLSFPPGGKPAEASNQRNGKSAKTLPTEDVLCEFIYRATGTRASS